MKYTINTVRWAFFAVWLLAGYAAIGADAKTYQVTGPVLEVTATTITVQKGEERWQIARDKNTKVAGTPKVGDKATVYYKMTATEIEVKGSEKTTGKK
jgi:hypothetical protein